MREQIEQIKAEYAQIAEELSNPTVVFDTQKMTQLY